MSFYFRIPKANLKNNKHALFELGLSKLTSFDLTFWFFNKKVDIYCPRFFITIDRAYDSWWIQLYLRSGEKVIDLHHLFYKK
jgi:hypothetical protein